MKKLSVVLLIIATIAACNLKKGEEKKTESGFKYIIYTKSEGPKIQLGDYVTLIMVYKNEKDSVLFDSRNSSLPLRFQLDKIPFKGSFEDGLLNLAKNDSATFYVPADSLYAYLFTGKSGMVIPQSETGFTSGTLVKFDIKVLNIQSPQEAEEEIIMKLSEDEKKERADLNKYLYDNNIKISPDPDGYYLIVHEQGKGETVDSGKIVSLEYEGRFTDGKVFDGTKMAGRPYTFVSGAHHVIKGWELAMRDLNAGTKFTLILPSKLAYGEEGIRNPRNGTFIVPPYKTTIFDMKILTVDDVPAVSGNNIK